MTEVIHASTFLCLVGKDVADSSNNKIEFIAEAALDGIKAVRFNKDLQLCCFVSALLVVKWTPK